MKKHSVDKKVEILLVEDREEDAELAIMSLASDKFNQNLHWVKDGQEAIDFLFSESDDTRVSNRPKLILLDINIPKINGFEVLKKIRNNEKTKAIPVVVLTTSRESNDIYESYNLGANSYVVKPTDFEEFTKKIIDIGSYWSKINIPPEDPQ